LLQTVEADLVAAASRRKMLLGVGGNRNKRQQTDRHNLLIKKTNREDCDQDAWYLFDAEKLIYWTNLMMKRLIALNQEYPRLLFPNAT
jgi:hypothetical protein